MGALYKYSDMVMIIQVEIMKKMMPSHQKFKKAIKKSRKPESK